jgi:hypothetical protein
VILAMGPRGVFGTGLGVAAIMTVAFHTGTAIKAHLKGFEGMASRILAEAGDEPFAVYKERYDEYFDPILFYLRRPVPVRTPGELGSCKGLVVLRRMLLEEARKGMADRRITILREFTEEAASADDRERRKIALARCE